MGEHKPHNYAMLYIVYKVNGTVVTYNLVWMREKRTKQ